MPLNVLTGQPFIAYPAKKLLGLGAAAALSLVLTACGNSGADQQTSGSPTSVQGNAVKGVIANGVVRLYYRDAAGNEIDLGQTRTDAHGNFALDLTGLADGHVTVVEISADSNTSMLCDRTMGCQTANERFDFAETMPLPAHFKLLGIVHPETGAAFVSPLSHLIVQTAQQSDDALNLQALEQASDLVQQAFELEENPLLARTPDLTGLAQEEDLSEAQLKQAILSAALFEPSMSPEWAQDSMSLDSLALEDVVLDASVIAGQLLDRIEASHGQYASAVASISEDTTEQYQALTYQAPAITRNPVSLSLAEGGSGNLSVTVNGTGPFTYQWFKDDEPVAGATSATLNFNAASLNDAGIYFVEVADAENTTRSLTAVLDVVETIEPIAITTQPQSQTLTVGATLTLSVSVRGDAPLYQWQRNGTNLPNGNSATYSLSNIQLSHAGNYRVVVSNSANSVTSNAVQVNVNEPALPVTITSQPTRQSVMVGGSISFSVTATGSAPITYQWRRNGIDIAGATGATLTLNNVQLTEDGSSYDVLVRNPVSTSGVRSSAASLEVSANPIPARIETQPTAQALTEGQPLLLQVSASGDAPIRYQWAKGGVIIPGATGSSYAVASVTLADAGDYYVTVENDASTQPLRSNTVTVVVTAALKPVSISRQPQNLTVTAGDRATFSVDAAGDGFLTYQWYKTSCNLLTGTPIDQANASTLTLNPVQLSDAGAYCVRITNGAEPPAVSTLASLTVLPREIPVGILTQPLAQTVYVGDPVTLSVVASGNENLSYDWFKDNNSTPIYSGGNVLRIPSAGFDDAGIYWVTVRNTDGESSATSNEVTVRVEDRPSLLLSWSRPLTRIDGTPLEPSQIHGYLIQYGYAANSFTDDVVVTGAETLSHELVSLTKGTVYVRIATIDSNQQQGPFSTPVSVTIP